MGAPLPAHFRALVLPVRKADSTDTQLSGDASDVPPQETEPTMRHLKTALIAASIALAPIASGSIAQAQDAERMAAAQKYLETPTVQKMMDDMLSPQFVSAMLQQMQMAANVTDDQRDKLAKILSEEFDKIRPEMERIMLESTAAHFTVKEIEALTAFYNSEEGAAIAQKMQPYMGQAMQQMIPLMQSMQQGFVQRVQAEMGQSSEGK